MAKTPCKNQTCGNLIEDWQTREFWGCCSWVCHVESRGKPAEKIEEPEPVPPFRWKKIATEDDLPKNAGMYVVSSRNQKFRPSVIDFALLHTDMIWWLKNIKAYIEMPIHKFEGHENI